MAGGNLYEIFFFTFLLFWHSGALFSYIWRVPVFQLVAMMHRCWYGFVWPWLAGGRVECRVLGAHFLVLSLGPLRAASAVCSNVHFSDQFALFWFKLREK